MTSLSWQWYPLVWAFYTRDTQAYRSSFKYFRQTGQRLEADRIEFTDEDTALQCPCHLHIVIWLWDMDSPEGWRTFHMNCQRRILGIRRFHFVTNASVTSQTGEEGLAIRICRRRLSIFGHVRRLPEVTPAHSALRLAVDTRAGGKPVIRPEWKRHRRRPCWTWVQRIEDDTGLNANDAWRIAHDRKSWRALRHAWPVKRSTDWLTDWLTWA